MGLHQWIRYAMPGSLLALLVGAWLLLDAEVCDCYGSAPDNQTTTIATAALLAAATLPVGFVISVLMNTLVHCGWQRSFLIRRLDHDALLSDLPQDRKDIPDIEECCAIVQEEKNSALVDYLLHAAGSKDQDAVVQRARQLIDTMNGLANGTIAIVLSAVAVASTYTATRLVSLDGHVGTWDRGAILAGFLVIALLLFVIFLLGHRRASRISEYYVRAVIQRVRP